MKITVNTNEDGEFIISKENNNWKLGIYSNQILSISNIIIEPNYIIGDLTSFINLTVFASKKILKRSIIFKYLLIITINDLIYMILNS